MDKYTELWKQQRERKAFLALADGTVFHGYAFGDLHDRTGEAVFISTSIRVVRIFFML